MEPQYVIQKSNGNLFPYDTHKHLLDNGDRYAVYQQDTVAPEPAAEESKAQATDRITQIVDAIKLIEPESYGKPAGGRPALPKVAAVATLTGFPVTVDEIVAAMAIVQG